jgi:hypothetical protein
VSINSWSKTGLLRTIRNAGLSRKNSVCKDLAHVRFWHPDVIEPAGLHPKLDRDSSQRLRQGFGGPGSRSLEAKRPCDGLAGKHPRHPEVGCRPIRWHCVTARKEGQPPCGPTHRMESPTPRSIETLRPFRKVFPVGDRETLRLRFALDWHLQRSAAGFGLLQFPLVNAKDGRLAGALR